MPNWTLEQRQAIEETGKNILVSAGAGSGKTAVLTERVIKKLNEGVDINNLLILTFTKAAASEMKQRIKSAMVKFNLKEQLDKIDTAYITTFDAYALSIVKKYHYILNVSHDVSIADESIIEEKRKEILDEIFEQKYEKKDSNFIKLIDDFCCKDDDNIKNDILSINKKLDLIYDKIKYLDEYIENYYSEKYINDKVHDYEDLLFEKLNNIRAYLDALNDELEPDDYQKFSDSLEELLLSNSYNSIKSNIVSLPSLPRNSSEQAKKYKDKLAKEMSSLESLCKYSDSDEIVSMIHCTKNYVIAIIDIIKELDKQISEFKYNHDLYEFIDVAKMAIKIVEDKKISEEIKNGLNEIMIDEYQDTNDLQELFISYISNNNVYMVGDIKQSIYSFRNANPNLFKEKYDKYSNLSNGVKIDLNKNFRSREEIVDSINEIFNSVMDNNFGGAEYKETHRMIYGNIDYKTIENSNDSYGMDIYNYVYDKKGEYSREEIETFIIVNDIKNKINNGFKVFDKNTKSLRNIKYNDIAILVDKKASFALYKKIFDYFNIPISIYDDEIISESMDFKLIKNIISLIINKDSDDIKYEFVSILRSYLFNTDDAEIFKYFVNNEFNESQLMKIVRSIDYSNLNCYELIQEIIDKFNFYERILTVSDIGNHIIILDHMLRIAFDLSKLGYTIKQFYDYLNDISDSELGLKFETVKNPDAIKLMTIHKSKGLEFNLCYYPALYNEFNVEDLKDRLSYDSNLEIISPIFDNGIRSTIYKELYKSNYKHELLSEKIRLFYVALTRAKEKIILLTPEQEAEDTMSDMVPWYQRNSYHSFLDIVNSLKSKLSNHIINICINDLPCTHEYNFKKKVNYKDVIKKSDLKLNVDSVNIENNIMEQKHFSKTPSSLFTITEFENIKFGRKMHSILENIDLKNPNYDNLDEFEKKCIQKFIDTKIIGNSINLYKEFEFVYDDHGIKYHGIIDLLIEYDDRFNIVDYKLKNISDIAYIKQLNGYKKYIESISSKPVSIYLYSILDGNLEKIE